MDYCVREQLSEPLQLHPVELISETLGANAPGGTYDRAALLAFNAHQFALSAEQIEVLD
jgi:hypothetical protein